MEAQNSNNQRSPIVVVLGHVDHGKTTLLDTIRKTSVAGGEAGGITQAIGASVVETKDGKKITFIDTPGHAAFTKMRGRGAKVADVAILVVALDDGVQPQTKEALQIIKDSGIPMIVAGTKSDVAGVTQDKVLGELEKEEIYFEGRGGDTPFVAVSARNGSGIEPLLEMVSLVSDVAGLPGTAESDLEGVVIESGKEKMGPRASVVLRSGKIKVGDTIYAENFECKVRALLDDKGVQTKEVSAGEPAQIFGFTDVPPVGAKVAGVPQEATKVEVKVRGVFDARRLKEDEVPVIIKAGNAGALEAIVNSLPPKVVVVSSGVGEVTSSEVIAAKTGNAYVFAFESKIPNDVIKLAEAEKVKVERFTIIYQLLEKIDEILKKGKIEIVGEAEVLASFPFNEKKVAGCKVKSGRISKGDRLLIFRDGKEIGKAKASSIRKQKQEIASVGPSEEFGVILEPQIGFQVGDVLTSIK
jgi:translation initiation factor IF-2